MSALGPPCPAPPHLDLPGLLRKSRARVTAQASGGPFCPALWQWQVQDPGLPVSSWWWEDARVPGSWALAAKWGWAGWSGAGVLGYDGPPPWVAVGGEGAGPGELGHWPPPAWALLPQGRVPGRGLRWATAGTLGRDLPSCGLCLCRAFPVLVQFALWAPLPWPGRGGPGTPVQTLMPEARAELRLPTRTRAVGHWRERPGPPAGGRRVLAS